jgi:hypothetical protein
MKALSLFTVIIALVLAGCSKKDSPQPQDSGTSSGNPVTAPADYLGTAAKAKTSAAKTVDLVSVSQAIKMFEAAEARSPKNLDELVEKGYLKKLPTPPAGMKFHYDPSTTQVKLVAAQ